VKKVAKKSVPQPLPAEGSRRSFRREASKRSTYDEDDEDDAAGIFTYICIHIYIYIYLYILYVSIYVCIYVYVYTDKGSIREYVGMDSGVDEETVIREVQEDSEKELPTFTVPSRKSHVSIFLFMSIYICV
jgi:hypothetical protein